MPKLSIEERMCRGCGLCVDVCPVDCFEFDDERRIARVKNSDDCLGCLSCQFLCPSTAVRVADVVLSKDFYRDRTIEDKLKRFL
jgi:2-oxoglutarate ferredoxin oxidoreductase subunit delta